MEIANKEELLSVIDDLQSRLAMVEDSLVKDEPEEEPTGEPTEDSTPNAEVESEDEIEKLLNS